MITKTSLNKVLTIQNPSVLLINVFIFNKPILIVGLFLPPHHCTIFSLYKRTHSQNKAKNNNGKRQ